MLGPTFGAGERNELIHFFLSPHRYQLHYSSALARYRPTMFRAAASSSSASLRRSVLRPSRSWLRHLSSSSSLLRPTPSDPTPPKSPTPTSSPVGASPKPDEDGTTHFGYRDIPSSSKESLVASVFSSVASSYDLMNDAMSLGIHRLWKAHFVSKLDPRGGINVLDVAGGTGDIALRILDHARLKHIDRETKVTMLDINPEMLREGMKRIKRESMYWNTSQIDYQLGNAEALHSSMEIPPPRKGHKTLPPLKSQRIEDESVDLYTIAFGIRNCTHIDKVLEEAYRVLKPGGVFACLEFGKVNNPLLAQIYKQYSFQILPSLGHILASDRDSYQYLVESIERFPTQQQFANMMKKVGFVLPGSEEGERKLRQEGLDGEEWGGSGKGEWEDLTGGIATIWIGCKL